MPSSAPVPGSSPWRAAVPAVLALAVVGGCGRQPDPPQLELAVPTSFSSSGEAALAERWWTAFADPELDARIERALSGNYDLAAAWHRLQAARAATRIDEAARWPELDATASAAAERGDDDLGELGDNDDASDRERFALGLAASYEVDLWGRIESQAEAAWYRERASLADYRTAAISLSAAIAETWYRLIAARGELILLEEQIARNEAILAAQERRFTAGAIDRVDLLRQQQVVAGLREDASGLAADSAVLRHRLAVLEGRAAGSDPTAGVDARLPEVPPLPRTGLPSELVQRRPDVLRAENLLLAANRDLAVAISEQYPRLSLSADLSTVDEDPSDLFRNWLAELAGNLVAPLFDGGARRAEVRRQEADERAALAEYAQSILVAFAEVEDALAREQRQRERLRHLREQHRLARATVERLRSGYANGASDFLDLLVAGATERRLQRAILGAERDHLLLRIALYRALAGGFETPRERSPDPASTASADEIPPPAED